MVLKGLNWEKIAGFDSGDYNKILKKLGEQRQQERKRANTNCCCSKRAVRTVRTVLLWAFMLTAVALAAIFTFVAPQGKITTVETRTIGMQYTCGAAGSAGLKLSVQGDAGGNVSSYLGLQEHSDIDTLVIFDFQNTNGTVQRFVQLSNLQVALSLYPWLPLYAMDAAVLSGGVLSTTILYVEVLLKDACTEEYVFPRGMEATAYVLNQASGRSIIVSREQPELPFACKLRGQGASGGIDGLQVSPGVHEQCQLHSAVSYFYAAGGSVGGVGGVGGVGSGGVGGVGGGDGDAHSVCT